MTSTFTPGQPGHPVPEARVENAIENRTICFAENTFYGRGGQGEFLRQMTFALEGMPRAKVFSRGHLIGGAGTVVPFRGWPSIVSKAIRGLVLVRGRQDWLALLSDGDFDRRLAHAIGDVDLLDAVIAQCCHTFSQLTGTKTRRVLTCLNTHLDHLADTLEKEHERIGYRGRSFIHPRMLRRARREIELADRIRVNSHWAKQTFVERGVAPATLRVIHPAVDLDRFHPVEKRDDVFRVLAVSTIDPRKGSYYLLQAFEQARIPNSELVLIGGTGDRWSKNMLQGFLSRNSNMVRRHCDVMSVPVDDSYGSASVVVHSALEDGYGLVIPQALASGRPVIATRQSGASELIQHGKTGFVVESASVDSIRDGLQLLAADRSLRERMSEQAPASVAHLSYQRFASEVRAFYAEVLA